MLIDFNEMGPMDIPVVSHGIGSMTVRMCNDDHYRIIPTILHGGTSIGTHVQKSGDDMNYVISGMGKAVCDGKEEFLKTGVMHICPKGSEHSIINTGKIFVNRIKLIRISMSSGGSFTANFDDDQMFFGHCIMVQGTLKKGAVLAQMGG